MKKSYLIMAAAAALFAACSSNDLVESPSVAQPTTADGDGAIAFDAYQSRSTTRAGQPGVMTISALQTSGFGVFSYYTNNEGYSELAKPDFMYNQEVSWSGSAWLYNPIKFWPNEFGSEASSERVDYLTFFAYAPYVTADPKTGKVSTTSTETGIIGLSRNTAIGDPLVKYVADFDPAKCVDLCWGVVADDPFNKTVTTTDPKNSLAKGKPYIDVIKPLTDSKIKFDFKHALTQLNVQIDTDIDQVSHGTNALDGKTRIYVRSVSFEGFTDRGTLNLNSDANATSTPTWYDIAGTGNLSTTPITVYDGRYDGREGVASVAAPAELPLGLNSKIVQSKPYSTSPFASDASEPGVQTNPVNLFAGATLETPILVIPNGQPLTIKVVYDVETYDPNLATFLSDGKTHGSTIENAITKQITLSGSSTEMKLESGKKYQVNLHLGLTSVKFDAEVTPWDDSPVTGGKGDLPINNGPDAGTPVAAGTVAIGGTLDVNMAATGGSYTFTLTGADDGAVNITNTTGVTLSGTPSSSSGTVDLTITVPANTTVLNSNGDHVITVTDAGSHTATVNIHVAHAALGLSVATPAKATETTFKLASDATGVVFNAATTNINVTLKRGGSTSTITPSVAADGTVTLAAAAQTGDIYTITVQAGDADAETVQFTVAKKPANITFVSSNVNYSIASPSAINQTVTNLDEDSAAADGSVTYSIAKTSGSGATTADIIPSTGVVTITGATSGDVFTVTATVADGTSNTYATKTATYTVTIKD